MKASEIKPDGRFFGMFVSRSSGGKSCAAASFPDPKLIIDTDLRKGIRRAVDWGVDLTKTEIKSFPPMTTTWKDIEKEMASIWGMFAAKQRPYETIIVDSLTTLLRIFMTDSIEMRGGKNAEFTLSHPTDYRFESQVCLQIFDYLRSMPCNVIISAHLVNKWGKDPNAKEGAEYLPDVIVGEDLSIRHALGENLLLYFDECYKFTKSVSGERHFVEFRSSIARTIYKMPTGPQDITDKNFYELWKTLVNKSELQEKLIQGQEKK